MEGLAKVKQQGVITTCEKNLELDIFKEMNFDLRDATFSQ